jgi:hypothetical protein
MAKKRYLKPRLPTLSRLIRDAFEDVSRGVEAQVRLAGVTSSSTEIPRKECFLVKRFILRCHDYS